MDPVTLASSVTAFLVPLLTKFGENFAEDAGKKLWDTIKGKFQEKPAATGAAIEFAAKADDPDNQDAFSLQLKKALKEDDDFAKEIAQLIEQVQAGARSFNNIRDSAIATEGSIAIGPIEAGDINGSFIVGNNNVISQSSTGKSSKASRKKKYKDNS